MIPNYYEHVKAAITRYPEAFRHAHVDGDPLKAEWVKLLAADLHAIDPKVGINGKRGDPRNPSMDAINILCDAADSEGRTPEGLPCVVVDVIGGAGGPNPTASWSVYNTRIEGSGAWVKPGPAITLINPKPEPQRPPVLPKGQAFSLLVALNNFYAAPEGLQRPGGMIRHDDEGRSVVDMEAVAQWFYQMVVEGFSLEDVKTQIRASHEWRSKHGRL